MTARFALLTLMALGFWSLPASAGPDDDVVIPGDPPEEISDGPITDLGAAGIDSRSVRLTWTSRDSGAEKYDIAWSEVGPIDDTNWVSANRVPNSLVPRANRGSESFVVGGLNLENAELTCWFAVRTLPTPRLSNSPSALIPSDRTGPLPPQMLGVTPVAEGSAELSWIAPSDDAAEEWVTRYQVIVSSNPISAGDFNIPGKLHSDPPAPVEPGQSQTMIVQVPTGLYYAAVRALDERNTPGPLAWVAAGEAPPAPGMGPLEASGGSDGAGNCGASSAGGSAFLPAIVLVLLALRITRI